MEWARSPLSSWLRNGNRNLHHAVENRPRNFQACSFTHSDISPLFSVAAAASRRFPPAARLGSLRHARTSLLTPLRSLI